MYFAVTINRVNRFLDVFIQQYINIAFHLILYITGGTWIIIRVLLHLLIIQQRECDLVINGNYIRIATYGKLNLFVQWHLVVLGPRTKLMGTSGKFNIFTALIEPKVVSILSIKSICPFSIIYDMHLYIRHTRHNVIVTDTAGACSEYSTQHEKGNDLEVLVLH